MTQGKRISVVCPVYNAERYLNRSVDSVLVQQYLNWELILVDDGSIDKSWDICEEYSKKDHRIQCFHQENQGPSAARNRGIDEATGDLLLFLDADDWFDENCFTKVINCWREDTELLLFDYFDAQGDRIKENHFLDENNAEFGSNKEDLLYIWQTFVFYQPGKKLVTYAASGPWCKVYRLDTIKAENLRFDCDILIGQDMIFNLYYLDSIKRVSYFREAVYFYYCNSDSATGTLSSQRWDRYFQSIKYANQLIKSHHFRSLTRDQEQLIKILHSMYQIRRVCWKINKLDNRRLCLDARDFCKETAKDISLKYARNSFDFLMLLFSKWGFTRGLVLLIDFAEFLKRKMDMR